MYTLTIIAIAVLTCYIVTMCAVGKGIPNSLSQTVFNLPSTGQWLWIIIIASVTFAVMPSLMEKSSESTRFLAFFACAGLMLVAVCPLVGDKTDYAYKGHMIGAYTAAIASQLFIAFNHWQLLLLWIPWIVTWCILRGKWRTKVFWAEMICFADIFIYVLIFK
jgi:Na+-translocating ferredoxin:NAD+ oxidoreductase RnfE subunit